MRVLIDGLEHPVRQKSIKWQSSLDDSIPKASFSIEDQGAMLRFNCLSRVTILEEPGYADTTHNILANPTFANSGAHWTVSSVGVGSPDVDFDGVAGSCSIIFTASDPDETNVTQTTRLNYLQPSQMYTFSTYLQTTGMANTESNIKLTLINADGSSSISTIYTTTTNVSVFRFSHTFTTASTNRFATLLFQNVNLPGSSTGTFTIIKPQLELQDDATLSYPTPECVSGATNCTVLGDSTVVRQRRLFGGLLMRAKRSYTNPSSSRVWDIEALGGALFLAKTLASANYSAFTDAQIVADLISFYLPNDLTTRNVISSGLSFDQFAWQDVPIKDILNTLTKSTGASYWVDEYFDVHMQVGGYSQATINLSDTPDNVTTFPFYDFEIEEDASEMANRIKVHGGSEAQKSQPAGTETFSGNGSNKIFTLGNMPKDVHSVTVTGARKKVGIKGRNTFSQGFDVLVNKPGMQLEFNVAPPNAANNVVVDYTYKNPAAVRMTDATSVAQYGYTFDGKIDDSGLVTQAAVLQRGIIALTEYSTPRQPIKLKTNQVFSVGDTVGITSRAEGWVNKPFIIQRVSTTIWGVNEGHNQIREYALELGSYVPTLTHHLLHLHKHIKHKSSHVSDPAEEHALTFERFTYSESGPGATVTAGGGGGTTALTLGLIKSLSTTLSTAGKMTDSVSSNSNVSGFTTHVGSSTGWGQLRASNGGGSWPALGAAGSPDGYGYLWDVSNLEGHTLNSGNWNISLRIGGVNNSLNGNLLFRAYKRSATGVYSSIGTATLNSQHFDDYKTYVFAPASLSSMAFIAGDKLYCDIWLQITSTNSPSSGSISIGAVAVAAPADSKISWSTPGYV